MDWPTITNDTTVEEAFEIHRRIWDDVLTRFERTGELEKPDTPYVSDCVLCQYAHMGCSCCPADWGSEKDGTPHDCVSSGMYGQFLIHYRYCKTIWLYRQSFREEIIPNVKGIRNIPRKEN